MRRLILGQITEFPDNNSWRFVDATYTFEDTPFEVEPFPELIEINAINHDIIGTTFIGVKIGDLNNSVIIE